MLTRTLGAISAIALAACAAFTSGPASADDNDGFSQGDGGSHGRPVKVMIISMFGPEGQVWLDRLGPWREITVDGLSPDYPTVHCNKQDVCVMTTGMGHSKRCRVDHGIDVFIAFRFAAYVLYGGGDCRD